MADKKQPIDKEYLLESLRNFDNKVLNKKYLQSNAEQLHMHTNKDILDKITLSNNGSLLFNGNEINTSASDGKSAYEIAVENGFNGTIEEWLSSLDGQDGISPTIEVYIESDSEYKLKITDKNGVKISPNLKSGNVSASGNGQNVSNINQSTFQNILKGEQKEVTINTNLLGKLILQAYKFINGNQNVENTLKNFNSENSESFNYNAENIQFDDLGVKIRDSYQLEFDSYLDDLYISQPFNLNDFVSLKGETQTRNLFSAVSQNSKPKPDSNVLIGSGKEMSDYEIKTYSLSGCGNPNGLFDGKRTNNFNTSDVCYWQAGHYVVITFMQPVNIYRSGTYNWTGHCTKFKISKLNEETETYTDITSNVAQTTSEINNDQWELTIEGLPAGTYKFQITSGLRLDSEWFLEEANSPYLLKNGDVTYCISEEYYDSEIGAYIPFDNSTDFTNIFCDSLFDYHDYLNGFRPIDKFSGEAQIIKKNYEKFVIQGIKSSSELIVTNNINKGIVETINSITLLHEKTDGADIKMVFSFDDGFIWNTFNFNEDVFESLNVSIPSGHFEEFSASQKEQWENAKNVILNNGVGIDDFNNTEFNSSLMNAFEDSTIVQDTIRIAYVLQQASYDEKCYINELKWNYNEEGYFCLMVPGTEYTFLVYHNKVIFKSLINSDLIKLNILS